MNDVATIQDNSALERLSVMQLYDRQQMAITRAALAKEAVDEIKAEMARRFGESAKAAFDQANKAYGTQRLALQGGIEAKVDIDKKVEWDSEKLLEIAQALPWDRVRALFKIDFSMSETIYKGVAAVAPDLQDKIDLARTVKYGAPKIALVRND